MQPYLPSAMSTLNSRWNKQKDQQRNRKLEQQHEPIRSRSKRYLQNNLSNTALYTYFSKANGTYSRIILQAIKLASISLKYLKSHKVSLIKIERNKKQQKKLRKFPNIWTLNNALFNNQWTKDNLQGKLNHNLK